MSLSPSYRRRRGAALVLVVVAIVILFFIGMGMLTITYGMRLRAIQVKNEATAMLAAEAGYERGIFWMNRQPDILSSLQDNTSGSTGAIDFGASRCDYKVDFHDYIGARPVFRITSTGYCSHYRRAVDVYVVQGIEGWTMGLCRVPDGSSSTDPVYFADGEEIDMLIHINDHKDSPDNRDIYISGSPHFRKQVAMGESRYVNGDGSDKYNSVMGLFHDGILFEQPNVRITDDDAVTAKVNRFRDSTKPLYRFTPVGTAPVSNAAYNAVQLEFFVQNGAGKVRVTNNCTVVGDSGDRYDYEIRPGSGGNQYRRYDVYAYHYAPNFETSTVINIEDTYVRQKFQEKESEPGGQIFVDGCVIIGSEEFSEMQVAGKVTVVATGNIWIADNVAAYESGRDIRTEGPSENNPNILGLIAQGLVKVVDPGLSTSASLVVNGSGGRTYSYKPVGNGTTGSRTRYLTDPTIVEAAVTVGGGGWGAENVPDRKVYSGNQDLLILRGTISEAVRGVVGLVGSAGYIKRYYLDPRLLNGVLPGDIWFSGKYIPAPAGWHDYRPAD